MSSFARPVGAAVDVAELEYVVALMQTCLPSCRTNGTISTRDIQILLRSRFGVDVSYDTVVTIVRELGGGRIGDDVIALILQEEAERKRDKETLEEQTKEYERKWHGKGIKLALPTHLFQRGSDTKNRSSGNNKNDDDGNEDKEETEKHKKEVDDEFDDEAAGTNENTDLTDAIVKTTPEGPAIKASILTTSTSAATGDDDVAAIKKDGDEAFQDEEGQGDGDDDEDEEPEEYLDLVQLTSILLMPTLARAAKEESERRLRQEEDAIAPVEDQDEDEEQDEEDEAGTKQEKKGFVQSRVDSILHHKEEEFQELKKHLSPPSIFNEAWHILVNSLDEIPTYSPVDAVAAEETATRADVNFILVSPNLVRSLLIKHGEYERAADAVIVDKMVETLGGEGQQFSVEALTTALTRDIAETWSVGVEDRQSSIPYDVFGFSSYREKRMMEEERVKELEVEKQDAKEKDEIAKVDAEDEEDDQEDKKKINLLRMFYVDFTVDAHCSLLAVVFIWVFFISSSALYMFIIDTVRNESDATSCPPSFGCTLFSTILSWLQFAIILTLLGFVVVLPLSVGNDPGERSIKTTTFALFVATLFTVGPIGMSNYYGRTGDSDQVVIRVINNPLFDIFENMVLICGIVLMCLMSVQVILAVIGNSRIRNTPILQTFFADSNVRGITNHKRAATRKINAMIRNAMSLHPTRELILGGLLTSSDKSANASSALKSSQLSSTASFSAKTSGSSVVMNETMLNYVLRGRRETGRAGGLLWTWKQMFSRELFDHEGIWIASRIAIIQMAQGIFIIFVIFAMLYVIDSVAEAADDAQRDLIKYAELPQWVVDFVPTSRQVRSALYPSLAITTGVLITIFLIYLPSWVKTTLMYRTGALQSLHSPGFTKYRINTDTTYMNVANAVYGMLGSGGLFFFLFSLLIFLFIWPFTQGIMLLILAWGIGLTITIVLKLLLTMFCRARFYSGFFRSRPGAANIATLMLESWYIGLGGGVLVGRMTQFILAAAFWVGRIDEPFLSPNVNLFGYAFDYVPTNFIKEVLVHEAHRHPYIERIATMYLMKIQHGDKFGTEEGACWRQLFVLALMPWLQKNRVFSDARLKDAAQAYNERRSLVEREEAERAKPLRIRATDGVATGLRDFADNFVDERPHQFHKKE